MPRIFRDGPFYLNVGIPEKGVREVHSVCSLYLSHEGRHIILGLGKDLGAVAVAEIQLEFTLLWLKGFGTR
jgi:hypothetical protein